MTIEATAKFTSMPIDEMEAIYGGSFKRARASLGATAFGAAVSDLPPGFDRVPPHNHCFDGQEELYFALAGGGELELNGEHVPLDRETFVLVSPEADRRQIAGPDGLRLLIVGATPGKPYEPFFNSELGVPETPVSELPGVVAAAAGDPPAGDWKIARLDEIEPLSGFPGVKLYALRRELGMTAFGLNLIELDGAGAEYPMHDHLQSGQEEIYVPVSGAGDIEVDGEAHPFVVGDMLRVAPGAARKIHPGPAGVRFIVAGSVPGGVYRPSTN